MRHKGLAPENGVYRVHGGALGKCEQTRASVGALLTTEPWAFVGRDLELQFIADRLTRAQPRGVVIAGLAGVGKTRLAREALAVAQSSECPTRWVAGTHAAAAIPLGAFAHLLPTIETTSDPLVMLQRAGSAITDDCARRPIIGVDDAHLLDELSVTLVHQLALTGAACVVLTVRTGEPAADPALAPDPMVVPDPVMTLWKDGLADRLELQPLPRAAADRLVSQVLGGVVASRTCEQLWRVCRGNALFLREMVEGGCHTGRLRLRDKVWHWTGPWEPTPRLRDIVSARLSGLSSQERAALELLATDEPLGLGCLASLTNAEVVATLERRGLVVVKNSGWRAQAWLAHPIYGAVVRDQLPEADACQLRRRLARVHLPPRRSDDLLRAGTLLLDSDEPGVNADLLADAAVLANSSLDHDLAARMARASLEAGGGVRARLALLEALRWQGRSAEAEQVAVGAQPLAESTRDRCVLAAVRGLNLFFGQGEAAEAEPTVPAAVRTVLAYFAGRVREAAECGREVATPPEAGGGVQLWALGAAGLGLAAQGRSIAALDAVANGRAVLECCVTASQSAVPQSGMLEVPEPELGLARLVFDHAELSALLISGRIRDAENRAAELHASCLSRPAWAGDGVAAMHLGWVALAAGRPRTALRWLVEAAETLAARDPGGFRSFCVALLGQAHALLDDGVAARRVLDGNPPAPRQPVFGPATILAQAWLAVADKQLGHAVEHALRAAEVAGEQGQLAVRAHALHTVVRLGQGHQVIGDLRQLAGQLDGPLVAVYRAHADAAAAGAGEALDQVADDFEAMDATLLAAEAAAHAAAAYERTGVHRRRAAAAVSRAASLARDCEDARTPAIDQLTPSPLTSREGEVAALVVQGLNNQAIAERLVLSVRTVEAHLAHAYAKLGINSRTELAGALGGVRRFGSRGAGARSALPSRS